MANPELIKIQEIHKVLGTHEWLYFRPDMTHGRRRKRTHILTENPEECYVRICKYCDIVHTQHWPGGEWVKFGSELKNKYWLTRLKNMRRVTAWKNDLRHANNQI
jgi:hypothetical protein